MYRYNDIDQSVVDQRVREFADQTRRYLEGKLSEDAFRALRLQNGLYIQRHAPMLRVAIPYGIFSSQQLRTLADIAERYDKGFGHFTTRQNIQFNWIKLEEVPEILAELAKVQMHAIQTSGNCIRNVTIDPLTDISADSNVDVRPFAELLRTWSTNHPEFLYLPRKFKIAINGAIEDRAVIRAHDIGLQAKLNDDGEVVFDIYCGGGLGRTPIIGKLIFTAVPEDNLLNYLEAILRTYNQFGRRDNKYKARIKILVKALGEDEFRHKVLKELQALPFNYAVSKHLPRITARFEPSVTEAQAVDVLPNSEQFQSWYQKNTSAHKHSAYRVVHLPLKDHGAVPGDISAETMKALADIADKYSKGELRSTHRQNLILPFVQKKDITELYEALIPLGLTRSNLDTATDIIACPGSDYCSLANAEAISVAQAIDLTLSERQLDDESILINISGCMNACGHHHVAGIGLLGVDKDGEDWYQVTVGGSNNQNAALGQKLGPAVSKADVPDFVARLVEQHRKLKHDGESIQDVVNRLGTSPFKEAAYV